LIGNSDDHGISDDVIDSEHEAVMEARLVSAVQNAARGFYGKLADSILMNEKDDPEINQKKVDRVNARRRTARKHRAKGCLLHGSLGSQVIYKIVLKIQYLMLLLSFLFVRYMLQ